MSTLQNSFGQRSFQPKAKEKFLLFFILIVLLFGAFVAALLLGSTDLSIRSAFSALLGGESKSAAYRILVYIRLPRAFASVLSGCALAVAGVLIQAVLNNPMAAPNVIGVNSGAGLAAVLMIAVFPSALYMLPFAAFFGALSACLLIYLISVKTGAGRLTVTLVGIAISSILNAAINAVKMLFPDSIYDANAFMIGGFSGVSFEKLSPAVFIIIAGLILAFVLSRDTDVLCLGDDTALSLGMNVKVLRFVLLMIASALAGAAVSFAGLLGFVGLLVPHIMRRFVGSKHRLLIPASALAGSILVLVCDLFSRVVFAPFEIPVGIVLSLIGGVFFIALVLMSRRREHK